MAAFFGDFDDAHDDEVPGPLLPPDDRLWRHPSELSGSAGAPPIDQQLVRRRWQQSEPSRASAWTAGLVGAVLAAGLVALGTHLAPAFTGGQGGSAPLGATVTSAPVARQNASISLSDLSPSLQASISKVGASIAFIETSVGTVSRKALGVIVSSNGTLVAPQAGLDGATSVIVLLDNVPYVGDVVASDTASGLALVQVKGVSQLPSARFSTADPPQNGAYAVAVTAPKGTGITAGTVLASSFDANGPLVDPMLTDLPASRCPLGSVLVDSKGNVIGLVTSEDGNKTLVTPAFMIASVETQLVSTGTVVHGWLGIDAATATSTAGVQVLSVETNSAAARAGLRPGDVIRAVDGTPVTSMAELLGKLYVKKPRQKVAMTILRGDRSLALTAVLGKS